MKTILKIFIVLVMLFCINPLISYALEKETHKAINEYIAHVVVGDVDE